MAHPIKQSLYERQGVSFASLPPGLPKATRAKGAFIAIEGNRRLIDLSLNHGQLPLGHAPRPILSAVARVLDQEMSRHAVVADAQESLAAALTDATGLDRLIVFGSLNSSAEALARLLSAHTSGQRNQILAMGRPPAALTPVDRLDSDASLSAQVVAYGDLKGLKAAVTSKTAAILLQPIDWEGRGDAMAASAIHEIQTLCDDQDILLIADERFGGSLRLGAPFSFRGKDRPEFLPDLAWLGRPAAGGWDCGAFLSRRQLDKAWQAIEPPDGSNSRTAAAAIRAMHRLMERKLTASAASLTAALSEMATRIQTETGRPTWSPGTILSIQLDDVASSKALQADLRERQGLLVDRIDAALVLWWPLTATETVMKAAEDALHSVLAKK